MSSSGLEVGKMIPQVGGSRQPPFFRMMKFFFEGGGLGLVSRGEGECGILLAACEPVVR